VGAGVKNPSCIVTENLRKEGEHSQRIETKFESIVVFAIFHGWRIGSAEEPHVSPRTGCLLFRPPCLVTAIESNPHPEHHSITATFQYAIHLYIYSSFFCILNKSSRTTGSPRNLPVKLTNPDYHQHHQRNTRV
jgi:hypothetical protein